VTVSKLDKKWMNPELKNLHRRMKREFYRNQKSPKWRKLKIEFNRKKRKAVKVFVKALSQTLRPLIPDNFTKCVKKLGLWL
jgi:hypothetical protein